MRFVMPAEFIRFPARMKNGTASSGNESMPLTIRWMTTKSGTRPVAITKISDEPAIAIATGMPDPISARNNSLKLAGLIECFSRCTLRKLRLLKHRGFSTPVCDSHVDRAPCHQCETYEHDAINKPDRQINHRHLLSTDAHQQLKRQPRCVAEEKDSHDIHQHRHHAHQRLRQYAVQKIHLNVIVLAHTDRCADKRDADQQITGNLLGPGRRVVQCIASEELQKNDTRQRPEKHERDPLFKTVDANVDRRVVNVELAACGQHVLVNVRRGLFRLRHCRLRAVFLTPSLWAESFQWSSFSEIAARPDPYACASLYVPSVHRALQSRPSLIDAQQSLRPKGQAYQSGARVAKTM